MLKPGTYKLSRDVKNPKPDRRVKEDWRAFPTWKAGEEFLVKPLTFKERDDEPATMWTTIVKVGHRWQFEDVNPNMEEQHAALEAALVPCEVSNAAFFTIHDIRGGFSQWLIESGRLSRDLFLKLWREYEDDGELPSREPYPRRPSLVEAEIPHVGDYKLRVASNEQRGVYTERPMYCTETEAFTEAARVLKASSYHVEVFKADGSDWTRIAELRLVPGDDSVAADSRDVQLLERIACVLSENGVGTWGVDKTGKAPTDDMATMKIAREIAALFKSALVLLVLAIGVSGCYLHPEPWGMVDLTVDGDRQFRMQVATAAMQWDEALYDRCGVPVFHVVEEGGYPVREYSATEWLNRGYGNTVVGRFDGEQVAIRGSLGDWAPAVTLHELGHALGLHHVSEKTDPESAMLEVAEFETPSRGDIERAALTLGCDVQ